MSSYAAAPQRRTASSPATALCPAIPASMACLRYSTPATPLDRLARAAQQPHSQLHYATIAELRSALAPLGYEPALVRTPSRSNPDHCTLGVAHLGGTALMALPQDAAAALVAAFHVTSNPYQQKP
jgi:hypothetical protein